ncbi:hypothetical protein JK628_02645 [Shewanella sp. KX20019]|uniref:hypothetical protein n=1 Tax=Shewanella sp. KX20019 TaxID=2803864 RepID=UPI001926E471|nr:hypothetical protein [Shewanella sp. KX20019]QQX80790.1 hypothetical protein JK628_02645 [Shewanella sp. KX20019]
MYNSSKKPVWYGELIASRGNTVIIYDKQFPEASAGRVYFYNTARDAIIEYAEEIVKPHLHELSGAALATAEANFGAAWDVARTAFMAQHSGWVEAHNPKTSMVKKAKPEPIIEPEAELEAESTDEDDFDRGWSNDDFDD